MLTKVGRFGAALLCAAAVVACSDSGGTTTPKGSSSSSSASSSSAGPTSLTKAEFVTKANAICQTMNDQLTSIPPAGDDPQQLAFVLNRSASIVSTALGNLRKLPIPAGDEATVNAIYAKIDTLLAKTATLADAYRAGEVSQARDLQTQAVQLQKDANDAEVAYGLDVCGA